MSWLLNSFRMKKKQYRNLHTTANFWKSHQKLKSNCTEDLTNLIFHVWDLITSRQVQLFDFQEANLTFQSEGKKEKVQN